MVGEVVAFGGGEIISERGDDGGEGGEDLRGLGSVAGEPAQHRVEPVGNTKFA
jgi:hypothetical protein